MKNSGEAEEQALQQKIWDKISLVEDPELGLSVTELGLIYNIQVEENGEKANISMTFTSMACPYGPQLKTQVHSAATQIVPNVTVEVVFSPPWDPYTMASEDARTFLGIY